MATVLDFAELESSSGAPAEDVRTHLMKAHSGLAAAIARVLAGEQELATDTIVVSFLYALCMWSNFYVWTTFSLP